MAENNIGSEIIVRLPEQNLPAAKQTALQHLLQGRSLKDTAQSTGVDRRTIYRWLKKDPAFRAVYNQWHDEMKESCRSRLLALGDKAADALEKALDGGDAKSALQLLKGIGLLSPVPDRATEEQDVRKEAELEAKSRQIELEISETSLRARLATAKADEKIWQREAK